MAIKPALRDSSTRGRTRSTRGKKAKITKRSHARRDTGCRAPRWAGKAAV